MATNKIGKAKVVDSVKDLITGTTTHLGGGAVVLLAGGSFTAAEITTKLQRVVTLREAVNAARAATAARLADEAAEIEGLRAFRSALVAFVKAAFAGKPDVLADFEIHPKVRAQPTVETQAIAVAKREATRKARGTRGPKAKHRYQSWGDCPDQVLGHHW